MRRRHGIIHKLVRVVGVIRLRQGYGGRVAPGYSCAREVAEGAFQHASAAKPFRCVGKDFCAALPANSDYPTHCRSLPRTLPWYSVKFAHSLRLEHGYEMAQLILNIAGCRNRVGDLLSQ